MTEENNLAKQIEKLIVDGQKEVMQGISQLLDGQKEMKSDIGSLKINLDRLQQELKRIDKKHDQTAQAQYDLMQDVKKDLGEVKDKLDIHIRSPHLV